MAKKPSRKSSRPKTSRAKKTRAAKPASGASASASNADLIIDAALHGAVEHGWARLSLRDIAALAGLTLAAVRAEFPSKPAILAGYAKRLDVAVLNDVDAGESLTEETPRDRLFDVLMRRIDAMDADKPALIAIAEDLPKDPLTLFCLMPLGPRSMAWMLAAAGLPATGIHGRMAARALSVAWALTVRAWFSDDARDHSHTMAVLDRQLGRLDRAAALCQWACRPSRRRQAAAA